MENSGGKIGFFKRIKIAVFNLEEYGVFLGERLTKSFKYYFLLILLITLATVIAGSYNFSKMMNTGIHYITNEMPDFLYEDGNAKFENNVEAYDHYYDFKLYINTDDEVSNETLNSYKNDIYSAKDGLILLKNKLIYVTEDNSFESTYVNLLNMYDLNISNKQELLETINSVGINNIIVIYSISSFTSMYVVNIITIFMDL